MKNTTKRFYSIDEIKNSGYGSRTTIWRDIKSGRLPAYKLPTGRVLIDADEFDEMLTAARVTPETFEGDGDSNE